jgi:phage repressor protein C with HTH and peptisase S24 domain
MVMIDFGRTSPSPPGIFVLDDGVGLVAKRVDAVPNSFPQQLRLSSDNPAYSNYQRRIDEVRILGRVVWFARSL